MTLTSQTKIGLTFGQVIAVLSILVSVGYGWMDMNIRVSNLEQNKIQAEKFWQENREDHKILSNQVNELIKIELQKEKK